MATTRKPRTKYRFRSRKEAEQAVSDVEYTKHGLVRFAMAVCDGSIRWFKRHGNYQTGVFDGVFNSCGSHAEEKIVLVFHQKGQKPSVTIWRVWSDIQSLREYAKVAATATDQRDRDAYDALLEAAAAVDSRVSKEVYGHPLIGI